MVMLFSALIDNHSLSLMNPTILAVANCIAFVPKEK